MLAISNHCIIIVIVKMVKKENIYNYLWLTVVTGDVKGIMDSFAEIRLTFSSFVVVEELKAAIK